MNIYRSLQNIWAGLRFYVLKKRYRIYPYDATNPKTYPIIIISFNQLKYLKELIGLLKKYGYKNIVVIDNASTYEPLLEYLENTRKEVHVHRLKKNHGHMVFWIREDLYNHYAKGYYAVTDADIVPCKDCPEDFMLYFKKILDSNRNLTKVGFSLKIDDIPEYVPYRDSILNWEKKFWKNKTEDGNYKSAIDTTFALYKPRPYSKSTSDFFNAIRTKPPYCAIHGGWYVDPLNLSAEQEFYFKTANKSSNWRLDEKGEFKHPELL